MARQWLDKQGSSVWIRKMILLYVYGSNVLSSIAFASSYIYHN